MSFLAPPKPWLCQGDIFASVPILEFIESNVYGPAMLVTFGCVIDKRNNAGKSRVSHLSFLPVRSVASLQPDQQRLIRMSPSELRPYAALYLGQLGGLGESYVNLVEPFSLPASMFSVRMHDFSMMLPEERDPMRLVSQANGDRLHALTDDHLDLFLNKWRAHWTGVTS